MECCLRYYKHMLSTHTLVFGFIDRVSTLLNLNIMHNDTRIKASKLSNFDEVCKCLLIVFCFDKSFFTHYCNYTWGNHKYFLPKFHENLCPIGILIVDAPTNLSCLIQWVVFNGSGWAYLIKNYAFKVFCHPLMILLSCVALFIK